jgi:cytochrome c553
MKIAKRDGIFIAVIVVVLGALLVGKSKMKSASVPYDDKHRPFYETMSKGGDRLEAEKGCATCHGVAGSLLTKGHPPKEQCLICHKLSKFK